VRHRSCDRFRLRCRVAGRRRRPRRQRDSPSGRRALGKAARHLRHRADGRMGQATLWHLLPRLRDAARDCIADGRVLASKAD